MEKSKYNSRYYAEKFFRNNCEELVRNIEYFIMINKLSGIQSKLYFNATNKSGLNNILKLHLEFNYKKKFTIYYHIINKKFYFNDILNKLGRLSCHASRKEISDFNDVYNVLDRLIEEGDDLSVLE